MLNGVSLLWLTSLCMVFACTHDSSSSPSECCKYTEETAMIHHTYHTQGIPQQEVIKLPSLIRRVFPEQILLDSTR